MYRVRVRIDSMIGTAPHGAAPPGTKCGLGRYVSYSYLSIYLSTYIKASLPLAAGAPPPSRYERIYYNCIV